jgi:hypothetical protein
LRNGQALQRNGLIQVQEMVPLAAQPWNRYR